MERPRRNLFEDRRHVALDLRQILVLIIRTPKEVVGGSCFGSPTMIVCSARAIAPIASQVVI